jgi:hypothetical protein
MKNRYWLRLILLAILIAGAAWAFMHFNLAAFFGDRQQTIRLLEAYGPLSVGGFIVLQVLQVHPGAHVRER